jgi:hypothetical protein
MLSNFEEQSIPSTVFRIVLVFSHRWSHCVATFNLADEVEEKRQFLIVFLISLAILIHY